MVLAGPAVSPFPEATLKKYNGNYADEILKY